MKLLRIGERGAVPFVFLIAIVGLVIFLLVTNTFNFNNSLFGELYPKPSTYAAGTFNLVGTNSFAASQSTAEGKTIGTLQGFNNKVYMGYGDYGSNTGPIQVSYYDPTTSTMSSSLLAADTEAIRIFRPIGSFLYAPATDSKFSSGAVFAKGEPWINQIGTGFSAIHVFDVASFDGTDLWAVGSDGIHNAVAWHSTNGGLSWTKDLVVAPISGVLGDDARFYFIGKYNNKLYVQARDYYGSMHPISKVYDGVTWSNGPSMFSTYNGLGWKPIQFAGKLVYKTWEPNAWAYLMYFDGVKDTLNTAFTVYDFTVDGSYLFALETNGAIRYTKDLVNWSVFGTGPSLARGITVLNDYLYLGTADSKLYKFSNSISSTIGGSSPNPTPTPIPQPSLAPSPTPVSSTAPASTPTPVPTSTPIGATDLTLPTVNITNPTNGSTLPSKGSVKVNTNASDASGIKSIEILIDSQVVSTCNLVTTCNYNWNMSKVASGPHTITARAKDNSVNQNTASKTISVTK